MKAHKLQYTVCLTIINVALTFAWISLPQETQVCEVKKKFWRGTSVYQAENLSDDYVCGGKLWRINKTGT
jgi:hypothetical protein